jgi:hypothetical protein
MGPVLAKINASQHASPGGEPGMAYRRRPRVSAHLGCLGCSIPLLMFAAVIAAAAALLA